MSNTKTLIVQFSTAEQYNEVRKMAHKHEMTISAFIRWLIDKQRKETENIRPSVAQLVKILSKDFSEMTETEFIEYVKTRLEDTRISVLEWSK